MGGLVGFLRLGGSRVGGPHPPALPPTLRSRRVRRPHCGRHMRVNTLIGKTPQAVQWVRRRLRRSGPHPGRLPSPLPGTRPADNLDPRAGLESQAVPLHAAAAQEGAAEPALGAGRADNPAAHRTRCRVGELPRRVARRPAEPVPHHRAPAHHRRFRPRDHVSVNDLNDRRTPINEIPNV